MLKIANSKEPVFAFRETVRRGVRIYYDKDGITACCDHVLTSTAKLCNTCNNCCIVYIVNDDGTYTCSACGKFPRELLLGHV